MNNNFNAIEIKRKLFDVFLFFFIKLRQNTEQMFTKSAYLLD